VAAPALGQQTGPAPKTPATEAQSAPGSDKAGTSKAAGTTSSGSGTTAAGGTTATGGASGGAATTATGSAGAPTTDKAITETAPTDATISATAATGSSEQGTSEIDAGTYAVRLRDLEQRINELKEQIFRSKARLSLLAETVLQGVVAGSQTVIVHENKMSGSYKLVRVVYALDGAPILNRADEEGGLSDKTEFDVYNGAIVPGEHTLTVNLEYRGHGYGIFSYLKGYRFKVRSSYSFTAPEGKALFMRVQAYEKGGPTAPLEERPAVRYVERIGAPVVPAAPSTAPVAAADATGAEGAK
jgi:hypothetical protein